MSETPNKKPCDGVTTLQYLVDRIVLREGSGMAHYMANPQIHRHAVTALTFALALAFAVPCDASSRRRRTDDRAPSVPKRARSKGAGDSVKGISSRLPQRRGAQRRHQKLVRAKKSPKHLDRSGGPPPFPTCSSMRQAEAMTGIPFEVIRRAKACACPAFRHGRIAIGPLIEWLFAPDPGKTRHPGA